MGDRILHITDLHFWAIPGNPLRWLGKRGVGLINVILRRRHEYRTERADEFAGMLAAIDSAAIIVTGDVSSTALDVEFAQANAFMEAIRARGRTVWALPGNHDIYTRHAFHTRRFERGLSSFLPGPEWPCRQQLPGGTSVVFAPTVYPDFAARGYIAKDEIKAVATLVREAPPGPVVVAAHYPLLNTTADYHSIITRRLRNADPFRQALGETGRKILYIAGHVHRPSCTPDKEYPHLSHLTTPPLFRQRHTPPTDGTFSEIEITDNEFTITRHHIQNKTT